MKSDTATSQCVLSNTRITGKTKTNLDDLIIAKVETPITFAIILAGFYVALLRLEISAGFNKGLTNVYHILVILNITWLVARIIEGLINEYLVPFGEKSGKMDDQVMRLLRRTVNAVIWIFGIVMALGNVGINIGAIITGLGIGGIAFALAAQDTIKNIFAGIVIFIDRPFRLGDEVKIDSGVSGSIEDIGLRSVRIRTYDKKLVVISCSKVVDSVIENTTLEPARRITLPLGLTYQTSPEKMQLALDLLKKMPDLIPEILPNVSAYFTSYGDYALNITFVYFIRKKASIVDTQSKVNLMILSKFNENSLDFAYPTTVIIKDDEKK